VRRHVSIRVVSLSRGCFSMQVLGSIGAFDASPRSHSVLDCEVKLVTYDGLCFS
jgi:hypothetical protein